MTMEFGLTTFLATEEMAYRGPELRPHFLLSKWNLRGSTLAAFVGPCRVETEHLVDWEDRLASDRIEARSMLHFLGEFFGMGLREGVLLQRLFMSIVTERLTRELRAGGAAAAPWREGDDIYLGPSAEQARKLSVSIVTASPVSLLLHSGINIDPAGAPVPAIGLAELGVDPRRFAESVLADFKNEWQGIGWACSKVRPVIG